MPKSPLMAIRSLFVSRLCGWVCVLAGPLALGGCTGLEPAFLGVSLQAAERGVAIVDGVDVNTFEFAPYEKVVAASDRAAEILALNEISRRKIGNDRVILHYQLRPLERLVIEIRQETTNITLVRTEVRSKVLQGVSAIYLRQLYHELNSKGAYIQEWAGQSADRPAIID